MWFFSLLDTLMRKLILDLCAGSGSWSKPYKENGYEVLRIDLPQDVRLLELPANVHGILAAPPCRVFANSGNRWPRTKEEMLEGLSVVDACIRVILASKPEWWALENPIGKLHRFLGRPVLYFDPCDYGDPYTKRTCLWGNFRIPEKKRVNPTKGSMMHTHKRSTKHRSITPRGFANAFFKANP